MGHPTPFRLHDKCAEIAALLSASGRVSLSGADKDLLAKLYAESENAEPSAEEEVLRLLTRPFSQIDAIPEYYRYTLLHVYDWFLRRYAADPVGGAVVALHATVDDLVKTERRALRTQATSEVIGERLQRLRVVRDQVRKLPVGTATAAELIDRVGDASGDWDSFVVAECTRFPMSDKHDEHVFLRSVQACELAFFLIRWFSVRIGQTMDEPATALGLLVRLAAYADLPNQIFHMLKTLTPDSFMTFRDDTGDASAVQSLNYQLMELVLYGYDERKSEIFDRFDHLRQLNEVPIRNLLPLRTAIADSGVVELAETWKIVERALLTWRGRHYGFGRLYLPDVKGSGGTEGAGYLKTFVTKDFASSSSSEGAFPRSLLRFASR